MPLLRVVLAETQPTAWSAPRLIASGSQNTSLPPETAAYSAPDAARKAAAKPASRKRNVEPPVKWDVEATRMLIQVIETWNKTNANRMVHATVQLPCCMYTELQEH